MVNENAQIVSKNAIQKKEKSSLFSERNLSAPTLKQTFEAKSTFKIKNLKSEQK
jgi:hypothetical protein